MQSTWYYARNGQSVGPISNEKLTELAATGQITPDDLVCRFGTKDWVQARNVDGLFARPQSPPVDPLPPRRASDEPASIAAPFSLNLGGSLANAGQLASNQAKRTSLATSTLPAAYLTLGKEIFDARQFTGEFATDYQRLDALAAKLAAVQQPPAEQAAQSFFDQAKSAALNVKRFAEEKALSMQFNSALKHLGEVAFQKYGAAAGDAAKRIVEIKVQIDELDTIIGNLSGQMKSGAAQAFASGKKASRGFLSKKSNQVLAVAVVALSGMMLMCGGCGLLMMMGGDDSPAWRTGNGQSNESDQFVDVPDHQSSNSTTGYTGYPGGDPKRGYELGVDNAKRWVEYLDNNQKLLKECAPIHRRSFLDNRERSLAKATDEYESMSNTFRQSGDKYWGEMARGFRETMRRGGYSVD